MCNPFADIPSTQRLKLDVGSFVPDEVVLAELTRMGPPLQFFVPSEEGSREDQSLHTRHMGACQEAKAQPDRKGIVESLWAGMGLIRKC